MWRPSVRKTNRSGWALLAVALGLLLGAGGCRPAEYADRMRRDYVAQAEVRRAQSLTAGSQADRERAVALAQRSLALAPASAPVRRAAVETLMQAQAWEPALAALQQMARQTGVEDAYSLGVCYLYTGHKREGVDLLEKHLADLYSLSKTGRAPAAALVGALNDVGYIYADNGVNLRRAVALTQEAVRLAPGVASFLDSLGWAYYRQGELDQAAFYLERALRLERGRPNAEVYLHAGVVHADQGRERLARAELAQALVLRPGYPQALYHLQRLRWRLPSPEAA